MITIGKLDPRKDRLSSYADTEGCNSRSIPQDEALLLIASKVYKTQASWGK
jgi:hypothetical protein